MSDTPLTPTERLDAVLYQYINLYERWSEDRQVFAKKGADLSQAIDTMQKEIERLQTLEDRVEATLAQQCQGVAKQINETIVNTATAEAKKSMAAITQQCQQVVNNAQQTLHYSLKEIANARWQWISVTVLTAVFCSVLFSWLVLPNAVYSLNPSQIQTMARGQEFTALWRHLSRAERKKWWRQLKASETEQFRRQ